MMGKHTRSTRPPVVTLGLSLGLAALGTACDNGPRITTVSATHFEVVTGSIVLGGRPLLVDTSNGDVWILEGERSDNPHWSIFTRGPDDVRPPELASLLSPEARDALGHEPEAEQDYD